MAFALTRFEAYGVEIDEPLVKRFIQRAEMRITGANTDVDLDIGDNTGTFWTAVGATEPGATALKALKSIELIAQAFLSVRGTGIVQKGLIGSSIQKISSAASAGGAASEALTVTGLLTTDTILAVTQSVQGANAEAPTGWNTQILNGLTVTWTGNPGAGAVIDVLVSRSSTPIPKAGEYTLAVQNLRPNLLFLSTDAPTSYDLVLEWELKDGHNPIKVLKTA